CIRPADLITASTRHEQGLTRGASDPSAAGHCDGQGTLHDPGTPSGGLAICAARVGTPPRPASTKSGMAQRRVVKWSLAASVTSSSRVSVAGALNGYCLWPSRQL